VYKQTLGKYFEIIAIISQTNVNTWKIYCRSDEALQRVVRMSNNGKLVATAGTDGRVRLWSFPSLKPLHDIAAHTKEVDDLDFSPDDKWVCISSARGISFSD
jgi:WD40 repeat protein